MQNWQKVFLHQATSCSTERTFSTGGSKVRAKRSKLDQENVNNLVFLRENLGKVKIEKLVLEDDEEKEMEKECLAEAVKHSELDKHATYLALSQDGASQFFSSNFLILYILFNLKFNTFH